jgi:drug/metabolite transporter (DMT)-like permease
MDHLRNHCWLYTILLGVHLSASGGQVYSSIILANGTNAYVFSFLFVTFGAISALTLALTSDYYAFIDTIRVLRTKKKHILGVIGLGLNNAIKSICFMLALSYVQALNAAVYIPLIPITAIVLTRLLKWEASLDNRQIVGICIAIGGALLVTIMNYKSKTNESGVTDVLMGNLLLVIWNFNVAGAIVLQKPLLKHYSPLNLSACIISVASIFLALLVPFIEYKLSRWDIDGLSWGAVIYCGGYLTFMSYGDALGITILPASTVAMWLVTEPVFTALLSYIVSDDIMSLWEYIGSFLTTVGLIIVLIYARDDDEEGSRGGGGRKVEEEEGKIEEEDVNVIQTPSESSSLLSRRPEDS